MNQLKARLKMRVTYDVPEGTPAERARQMVEENLSHLVVHAAAEGLLTSDGPLEVFAYEHDVVVGEVEEEPAHDPRELVPDPADPGTELWTVVQIRKGAPGGFHKAVGSNSAEHGSCDGRFWCDEAGARAWYAEFLKNDPEIAPCFMVAPFVATWLIQEAP